uniref:ATP synthase complex subunit 8 n=1 Tax=Syrbatus sp. 1 RRMO-2024a TaxID=3154167 RepID=A0AAU7LKN4_9COLE
MPQMSPMMWMLLFTILNLNLFISITLNFYFKMFKLNNKKKKKNNN